MQIAGQVAVVTGAARGIGAAIAEHLVDRGAAVAFVDRASQVHDTVQALALAGSEHKAAAFVGDVADEAFRREVFAATASRFGAPTLCVPAAGITKDALAVKRDKSSGQAALYPEDDFRAVLEVDLVAPVYWGLELIRGRAEHRAGAGMGKGELGQTEQGVVVFIGSVSARGNRGQIAYSAAKAGLAGAALCLAMEARFFGVRCAIVHPGFTDTAMARALGDALLSERVLPRTRLGRLITPAEVASAVGFVIENAAAPTELWLDGGWQPAP